MRNADLIARALAEAGCRHAFGIPGGEVLTIIDALQAAGIAFHLTKHENFAGFMAEGTWHASGAPAVLVATIGPGLANAVNVIANAEQDRVPLVVLTGCLDEGEADTYTHQIFDHRAVLAPVVKGTFRAAPASLPQVMDKALTLMRTGQPGPVHIDVPIAVAAAHAQGSALRAFAVPPPSRPAAGAALSQARDTLAAARRPIAVAGLDAVNEGAAEAVASFVRAFQVPLITTYKAKGVLDETDPLALGGAGLSPLADRHLLPLLAEADCIVLVGYDPIEMRTGWRDPFPADVPIIDVTPVPRTHGMHAATHTFIGGVAASLEALTDGLTPRPVWENGAPSRVRDALGEAFSADGWGPHAAIAALGDALAGHDIAGDAIITADSGAHRILLSQMWRCRRPRTLLQSSAFCTMGCAVALAAGHRLADPTRPAVAVVGDAGLEMVLGDLVTVRDLALSLPIVVLVDESLALIELKQRREQLANVGVDFAGTNFPAVAEALGGSGVWIDDAATLTREVHAALERGTFTLLCARIGRRAYDGAF